MVDHMFEKQRDIRLCGQILNETLATPYSVLLTKHEDELKNNGNCKYTIAIEKQLNVVYGPRYEVYVKLVVL